MEESRCATRQGSALSLRRQVAPAIKHLQEAMRNDPDNGSYRTEIKKWRAMEAQKDGGNDAFKHGR